MTAILEQTAAAMMAPGKGILAADESTGTIGKRFDMIGVENTEGNRRDYRELLFGATETMTAYISGVILFDETLRQSAKDGTPFTEMMKATGSVPGIKVDMGAKTMPLCAGETVTSGLDGLDKRLAEYFELGARFAKWRAVVSIGEGRPTWGCVKANAQALARYAALCQEANIVPIVEPEILMDGPDSNHDIDRCYEVTTWTLKTVFSELYDAGVQLEGIILKPNMVIGGQKCTRQASVGEVAEKTLKCLKNCAPAAVPGIAFLSGGQSEEEATAHLSAMAAHGNLPWPLTFSYGRALQQAALKAWGGKSANVDAARDAFTHRARMNSLASTGRWSKDLETGG